MTKTCMVMTRIQDQVSHTPLSAVMNKLRRVNGHTMHRMTAMSLVTHPWLAQRQQEPTKAKDFDKVNNTKWLPLVHTIERIQIQA